MAPPHAASMLIAQRGRDGRPWGVQGFPAVKLARLEKLPRQIVASVTVHMQVPVGRFHVKRRRTGVCLRNGRVLKISTVLSVRKAGFGFIDILKNIYPA